MEKKEIVTQNHTFVLLFDCRSTCVKIYFNLTTWLKVLNWKPGRIYFVFYPDADETAIFYMWVNMCVCVCEKNIIKKKMCMNDVFLFGLAEVSKQSSSWTQQIWKKKIAFIYAFCVVYCFWNKRNFIWVLLYTKKKNTCNDKTREEQEYVREREQTREQKKNAVVQSIPFCLNVVETKCRFFFQILQQHRQKSPALRQNSEIESNEDGDRWRRQPRLLNSSQLSYSLQLGTYTHTHMLHTNKHARTHYTLEHSVLERAHAREPFRLIFCQCRALSFGRNQNPMLWRTRNRENQTDRHTMSKQTNFFRVCEWWLEARIHTSTHWITRSLAYTNIHSHTDTSILYRYGHNTRRYSAEKWRKEKRERENVSSKSILNHQFLSAHDIFSDCFNHFVNF